jgi:glycosyltransferase involved in cell wall biosynthesis
MDVTIDISSAVYGRAGLGRYAENLAAHLSRLEGCRLSLFYNRSGAVAVPSELSHLPARSWPIPTRAWRLSVAAGTLLHTSWDWLMPDTSVFHATEHLLPPFRRIRTVLTVHDLIYVLFPEYHLPMNYHFLRLMMPRFARRADAIIAISECTRRDLVRLWQISEGKISVIHEGIDPRFHHPADEEALARVRRRYGLPERYALYVGTIEPRKNLPTLFEAWARLRYRLPLVIAGKKGWLFQETFSRVESLDLGGVVQFTGFVADEDLPALYAQADIFVFPSLYEGFGLPVLEAMACGTPVVTTTGGSLPEVAGDAALLVKPGDVDALTDAVDRLLHDPSLADDLRARGISRARQFSWERAARETLAVYHGVAT